MSAQDERAPRLLFFAGSIRKNSFNKRVAKLAASMANGLGFSSTFIDLADYPMPFYDGDLEAQSGQPENARKLKDLMCAHQGIMIVSPEYNASFAPLLKNTIDWVSRIRDEGEEPLAVYRDRVFALAAASPGGTAGLRGLMQFRQVLELGIGALVLPNQFLLPRAADAFDNDGNLKNHDQEQQLQAVVKKLEHAARVFAI
ncbi:NADPH-dependent FMN reductase [Hyphomicrobium methylovorum]|uniref:NADPH-dependent FMN reductase n=1 Tax=Hyphomicrobium methylovorum TaxID=84 RepID=UPI0015E7A100|nr:NAD(P)H-dependent oxidoreductase [Hyphomicrobium methylovorum]MBA2126236.1 NADPH-dependent FMN reductase [Hyphomicrobium methylovorum]